MTLRDIKTPKHIKDLTQLQIKELQTILSEIGYKVAVDAIYGNETLTAFNQFKTDKKLTEPNLIGVTTVDALYDSYAQKTPNEVTNIDWHYFKSPVSKWFTVGEVFQNKKERFTNDSTIRNRIVTVAKELDKVRQAYGSAILVNSWYRPPSINQAVGGASNSRHLYGDGVDIRPLSGSLTAFEKWLDKHWYGALGYGSKRGFVHVDMRNNKGFDTGGSKSSRWTY